MTTETPDDITERLRWESRLSRNGGVLFLPVLLDKAADEIDSLRAQVAQYEDAIKQAGAIIDPFKPAGQPGSYARGYYNGTVQTLQAIRAAIDKDFGQFGIFCGIFFTDFFTGPTNTKAALDTYFSVYIITPVVMA